MKITFKDRPVEIDFYWLNGFRLTTCYWLDTDQELTDDDKDDIYDDQELSTYIAREAEAMRKGF